MSERTQQRETSRKGGRMQCKCKRCRFYLKCEAWMFQYGDTAEDDDCLVDLNFLVGGDLGDTVHCPACGTALWADGYAGERPEETEAA